MRYWTHTAGAQGRHDLLQRHVQRLLEGARPRGAQRVEREAERDEPHRDPGGGATCTLIFVCSTVSSRYANPTRPASSEPIVAAPDLYVKILGLRGSGGIQLEGSERLTVATLRQLFGLKIEAVRTDFKRTPQGAVWMCDETVDALPIQKAFAIQVS
jgi:hypothetical protein